ncbi:hypothetical protein GCM10025791_06470 [Halioxenophilus aromaticivorans]|uniref:Aldehyde dehydrogenase domain-containing protein n=1 Tax=Halioxenophilus aromaticivorans TaxID=1306992 RepID=A0AAV3TYF2_9ALTE
MPTTLELGGKSLVIVGQGADIKDVAERAIAAKPQIAGQTYHAPDCVLMHCSEVDTLVAEKDKAAKTLFPRGILSPDYVILIQQRHVE